MEKDPDEAAFLAANARRDDLASVSPSRSVPVADCRRGIFMRRVRGDCGLSQALPGMARKVDLAENPAR
jgi:hypothetical protein